MYNNDIKTNITLAGNVYVRNNREISKDGDFVRNISGRAAVSIAAPLLGGWLSKVKLSPEQKNEQHDDKSCALALDGERTHGIVLLGGKRIWSCRCENTACMNYNACMSEAGAKRIVRDGAEKPIDDNPSREIVLHALEQTVRYDEPNFGTSALSALSELSGKPILKGADTFAALDSFDFSARADASPTSIFCASDAEAILASSLLRRRKIAHSLLTSSSRFLPDRIYADSLWDYADDYISKEMLIARITARSGAESAQEITDMLFTRLAQSDSEPLSMAKLTELLSAGALSEPKKLDSDLIVTSVPHSESGKIFVLESEEDYSATPLPKEAELLGRGAAREWFYKTLASGRLVQYEYSRHRAKIRSLSVSDGESSLLRPPTERAELLRTQEYISEHVRPNDELQLLSDGEGFSVLHEGNPIGTLSDRLPAELSSTPDRLSGAYVSRIYTQLADGAEFGSGLLLGVELAGMLSAK